MSHPKDSSKTPKTDYAEMRIWDRIASARDISDSDNFKEGLDEAFHHARQLETELTASESTRSRLVKALEENTQRLAFMAGAFGDKLTNEDRLKNTSAFMSAREALSAAHKGEDK